MSESNSKTVVLAALTGNFLIAVSKFVASAFTGSTAMLAEGIHSVIDTGNQGLLLYGMRRAKKPPDAKYPFGYGKEIYFWSFMVAVLLFTLGAGISIYEGVEKVLHPHPIDHPLVNYGVLGLAVLFEGTSWLIAAKEFRRVKGSWGVLEAVRRGKDPNKFLVLFEDTAAIAGLLLAAGGLALVQVTGIEIFDGLASIGIGCILAFSSVWLAVETKGLLIGEAANKYVVQQIETIVSRHPSVARVNEVPTMHIGPEYVLANISLRFKAGLSGEELQNAIADMDREIKTECPTVKRIFIEAEHEADRPPSHADAPDTNKDDLRA
ncbi:cation diffusion facilitator family transporter [Salinisphaera hydrothermalis]|uniref:Co/Zn/Cd cation transporter n=1 Tax=Salinisphaera hydrothermalis (strain C41B8) TaxID=1304275 RepID=A0A084IKY8_SALHC|nr:cation diffusion facilitator family transporter [Salinisphaera hydrothermalis]KEZ77372.1 Co/Zn/Cd cation transporter [Salinisphaera hydrothermalis C41B8]